MKITRIITLTLLIWCMAMTATAQIIDPLANKKEKALPPDSLGEVEDNPFLTDDDKKTREPVDSAKIKGFEDYAKYIMDIRDRGINEDNHKHWFDNLYLQAGAGAEQIIPFSDNFRFDPMTTGHFAVGIQVGKYNSFRLKLHGGLGYQKYYDRMYGRLGFKVDHVFDLSSFLEGYQPTRMLGIGTVLGFGAQKAKLNNYKGKWGNAVEGHGGLQFRFYTGPNGYLNVEPYLGLASDQVDLSELDNWRRFDVLYGVNINFVYYLTNHLSRQARARQIEAVLPENRNDWVRYENVTVGYDEITKQPIIGQDSILQSWQTPWSFDFALGANLATSNDLSPLSTLGSSAHLSAGKWISQVIGARFTASTRSATWTEETVVADGVNYTNRRNMEYYSLGAEVMMNPFGLSKNFAWDNPYGLYVLAGGEYGWIKRDQKKNVLHCRSEAYTAGLRLWYKLSDGVQIFVEPRFTHNVYKIPYKNARWNHRYSDNTYGLRVGLTAQTVSKKFWKKDTLGLADDWSPLTVGVGAGLNIVPQLASLKTNDKSMPYNYNFYVSYYFDKISGARLSAQYMTLSGSNVTSFIDYNMNYPGGPTGYARTGVWNHHYQLGIASLNYVINFSNAMAGYMPGRIFNLEAFFGPGIARVFGDNGELDDDITMKVGHKAALRNEVKNKSYFVLNGGATVSARILPRMLPQLSATLTPQLYLFPLMTLPGVNQGRPRYTGSVNVGVQYKF